MSNLDLFRAPDRDDKIKLHGPDGFAAMRKAGRLAALALDMLVPYVVPGVTTEALDARVLQFALDHKALPATLNYRGYTHSTCMSINHVVCHGIPGPKALREGDIVNIDVTLIVDGWHGDTSRMYAVGPIKPRPARLIEVTYESLARGIAAVKPGATTGHIGAAIQAYAESQRCSVVRDFCGHGLGADGHAAHGQNRAADRPGADPGRDRHHGGLRRRHDAGEPETRHAVEHGLSRPPGHADL